MNRLERRLVANTALAGLLLTGLIAVAEGLGLLDALERALYDERIALCQYFMPAPTDRLVHLDIDDAALETIGAWPWPRARMAQILDEMRLAGPKAVALDVLYPESQTPEWVRGTDNQFTQVDHDALLARSLKALDNTVVPASFPFPTVPTTPVFRASFDLLIEDPELTPDELTARLRETGFGTDDADLGTRVNKEYVAARREAMYVRIRREMGDESVAAADLRPRVLKKTPPGLITVATRVFDQQHARAVAALELRRFAAPIPTNAPTLFHARLLLTPIAPLIRDAAASGFVDYPPSLDGKVRSVPLFIESEGRMHPQIGLSLACEMLGTDLRKVRFEPGQVVVPRAGQADVVFPVHTLRRRSVAGVGRDVPLAIDLPWFGGNDWQTMYDTSKTGASTQHLSLNTVWQIVESREKIGENLAQADDAISLLYEASDSSKLKQFKELPPAPGDIHGRLTLIGDILVDEFVISIVRAAEDVAPEQRNVDEQKLVRSAGALREAKQQLPLLRDQVDTMRAELHKQLNGKAVLVGWIATGAIADFVPTPLHAVKTPGPVVHGVVFNAVMTGETWRRLPVWATVLTTLGVGLLATSVVSLLAPGKALLTSMSLLAAYLAFNGIILFDWGNVILGAAGPLVVIGAVWSGGTLTRLFIEQHQRALIRRRFRTYVDPRLVDYVERHPEQAGFEGENREMTVVFTDLVGFTKLTEALGEETVKLLNELWSLMVPTVRRDGYLNKFLGDGIMFFFGAPEKSGDHAGAAVRTVLELSDVMCRFNEQVTGPRNLPTLGMRFGVSTGNMIVGDAGAGEAGSDYTVLGDNVNLGSRLEGANKATGTTNLLTARTVELAGSAFLFRPIARLRVVGKLESVMTYEALGPADKASAEQNRLTELTKSMVEAYLTGRFEECLIAIESLESSFGKNKLSHLYRENAERNVREPDPAFDGTITLTEK